MRSNRKRPVLHLLHIDDDPNDRRLIQEAIRTTRTPFYFHGAEDLEAAMDHFTFLPRVNRPFCRPRPALVLLDYDLGTQCGTDFLYWLRTQHLNTAIPVVMYSGSGDDGQVRECYAYGANQFLRKAQSLDRSETVIRALHACFFLRILNFQFLARLPESEPDPRLSELVVF